MQLPTKSCRCRFMECNRHRTPAMHSRPSTVNSMPARNRTNKRFNEKLCHQTMEHPSRVRIMCKGPSVLAVIHSTAKREGFSNLASVWILGMSVSTQIPPLDKRRVPEPEKGSGIFIGPSKGIHGMGVDSWKADMSPAFVYRRHVDDGRGVAVVRPESSP